jgi:hypothetical protein
MYVYLGHGAVTLHSVTVPSQLLRIRRRRRAVAAPSPRGCYGKFAGKWHIAKFNQIAKTKS